MKRLLILLSFVCVTCFSACEYDDSALVNRMDDFESRLERLEELCAQMNTNISSLQTIVNALQQKDFITAVAPITKNGEEIGYTIGFTSGNTITIYHGKDGENGENGEDGTDGHTPIIGVKRAANGIYYWTIDGDWLLDENGAKVQAAATNGEDGADGEDGVTPMLKIENDYWYVSYDKGKTWSKLSPATIDNESSGNNLFKSVTQDDEYVYFRLTDGTLITLPKESALDISFNTSEYIIVSEGESYEVTYTIKGADFSTKIAVVAQDNYTAKVVATNYQSGKIVVTAPSADLTDSQVLVFVSKGTKTIMRALYFSDSVLSVSTNSVQLTSEATQFSVTVTTNLDYSIYMPSSARSWLSVNSTRALREEAIQFSATANTSTTLRSTIVELRSNGKTIQSIAVSQDGIKSITLTNGDFESGLQGWLRRDYGNGSAATLEVVNGEGENGSKALMISQSASNGKCSVALERTITGLEPDQMYRMTARMKYSDIANGCGAVIFSPNDKQYWNASVWTSGNSNGWTTATVDFMSDDNGTAKISCALGFWLSTIASGGYATGTVYYDNVSIAKVTTKEHYMRESKHMRIYFDAKKTSVTDAATDVWLKKVDDMYEAYEDLVGIPPLDGRKLAILTSYGMYAGYWALAGYPILWNANHGDMDETINEASTRNTISFGLMHEMGHVFNVNYTYNGKRYYNNWDWNDEMFANFRMQYGLEMTGNAVYQRGNGDSTQKIYRGREILNMYKQDYDATLPKGKLNDNAIHYLLARLADDNIIGWEPFRRTFREITTKSCPYSNNYDKFTYFVNMLSRHASNVHSRPIDLLNDKNCFTDADIAAIKKQLQ
ncbi:MAG: hypothetical protein J6L75_02920 [Alistipes sp.]|nr:hypothetical protein [Alistipes sp.]